MVAIFSDAKNEPIKRVVLGTDPKLAELWLYTVECTLQARGLKIKSELIEVDTPPSPRLPKAADVCHEIEDVLRSLNRSSQA